MPYPRRLLHDDEEVHLDARPHPLRLLGPSLVAAVVVAGSTFGLVDWTSAPGWFDIALGVVIFLGLAGAGARYLGWRSTNLVLTSTRVIYRHGVLHRVGREIPLDRIQDVTYHQSLGERLVGAGKLIIESAGEHGSELFPDVRHPEATQSLINQAVDGAHRPSGGAEPSHDEVMDDIERLAELHRRGVLTDAEFAEKKAELLGDL